MGGKPMAAFDRGTTKPSSPSGPTPSPAAGSPGGNGIGSGVNRPAGTGGGDTPQSIAGAASKAAGSVSHAVSDTISDVGSDLASAAQEAADSHKETGTRFLHSVSRAVDAAASALDQDAPTLAEHIRDAGRSIDGIAEDFDQRSIGDIMRSATDFAHRQPLAFFAGAALLGFMAARLMKTEAPSTSRGPSYNAAGRYRPADRSPGMTGTGSGIGSTNMGGTYG
jgi:hypothetical protein